MVCRCKNMLSFGRSLCRCRTAFQQTNVNIDKYNCNSVLAGYSSKTTSGSHASKPKNTQSENDGKENESFATINPTNVELKSHKVNKKLRKTSDHIVQDVANALHHDKKDAERRWETYKDLTERLEKLKVRGSTKNNHEKGNSRSRFAKKEGTQAMKKMDYSEVERCERILRDGKERVGIFKISSDDRKSVVEEDHYADYKTALDWWDEFKEEDASVSNLQAPSNHYMEMLSWSKQGRLPSFPIDNEEGIEEERDVPFYKHVFLDELLEDGFPKSGPIRKFMEAVTVGLSSNPYLTLKEKEDHVRWFRDYFNEKRETLITLGAVTSGDQFPSEPEIGK